MKKFYMLVIALAMLALTACGATTSAPETDEEVHDRTTASSVYEKYNIMTFETVEMQTPETAEYGFINAKIKVTNNSEWTLKSVCIDATFRDADGNSLSVSYPQHNVPVGPGEFYVEEALLGEDEYGFEDAAYADVPSYYIELSEPDESGYMFFHVDTVNKTVEAIY